MSKSQLIKWLVTIGLTLVFVLIPETGFYVGPVKKFFIFTVFCLSVIAFEFFPMIIPAAMMPMAWAFFGVCTPATAMAPWMGSTMLMCIGTLVMVATLTESGLLNRIAFWMMSKLSGNFTALLIGIFIVGSVLNVITVGGPSYIIMGALCAGLCMSLGIMKTKAGAAIAFACMVGTCTSHSYTMAAQSYAVIRGQAPEILANYVFTPLSVLGHNWPMIIVSLVMVLICAKWYKPEIEFGGTDYFQKEYEKLGKMSYKEKCNAIMLITIIVLLCTAGIHKVDINYVFCFIPYVLFFIGGADPKCLKTVNYEMIFFVAACMSIGVVASSLGLGNIIADVCMTVFAGRENVFFIFAVLFAIIFVLNFLMTPMAIWSLFSIPLFTVALQLGMDPLPFVYSLVSCSEAILFPYEFTAYLLIFSFGMISMKDFVKLNIMRSSVFLVGFLVVLIPYWMLIGLL